MPESPSPVYPHQGFTATCPKRTGVGAGLYVFAIAGSSTATGLPNAFYEKRCAGARESGEEFVGGARGMRATILEKAVAVRLATALGHFKTKQTGTGS